ncbi:hypothetical protein H4R26_005371 [Coemansia thaxteri]|uniref:Vacuolar ATPase assembly integral membrane protein VMA21 n=1 Tax=Coemansia thaxteri TaxID=2663907 RepID=A0A9W8BD24_9FUNG|nr:hypothetical protein H4R26_005371 [Coemansia thaxteri]KAJ2484419.1 hypothetical protein EV174_002451 [Coemansia sp. RSA 2320]
MPKPKAAKLKSPAAATTTAAQSARPELASQGLSHRLSSQRSSNAKSSSEAGQAEEDTVPLAGASNIPGHVIQKLFLFSALLLVVPILAYYVSLKHVFVGSAASSAIVAVIVANLVLAAYVYVAWIEDASDQARHVAKGKLKQG